MTEPHNCPYCRTNWVGNKLYVDGVLAGTVNEATPDDIRGMVTPGWLYVGEQDYGSGFHGGFRSETEARAYLLYDVIERLKIREEMSVYEMAKSEALRLAGPFELEKYLTAYDTFDQTIGFPDAQGLPQIDMTKVTFDDAVYLLVGAILYWRTEISKEIIHWIDMKNPSTREARCVIWFPIYDKDGKHLGSCPNRFGLRLEGVG